MRIVSFNINSIRARPHQLIHLRDTLDPDVIGLQETKVNDPDFPLEVIEEIGYHPEYWGQKGHYGVAFLSKKKPIKTIKGFKKDTAEDQKRFIECTFSTGKSEITIMNGYFPQGENINHESKFPKKIKHPNQLLTETLRPWLLSRFQIDIGDYKAFEGDLMEIEMKLQEVEMEEITDIQQHWPRSGH